MGIADSIISAFLSHQFAKERQEQALAAQEKQQKEQSQARLQQQLMMKDIVGQQQEQRLQEQIAARKAQQEDSQAFRKDLAERYKLDVDSQLRKRDMDRKYALEDAKLKSKDTLDRQKAMADYRLAQSQDPQSFANRMRLFGAKMKLKPYEDSLQVARRGKDVAKNLYGAYAFLNTHYPELLPVGPTKIEDWAAQARRQVQFKDPRVAAAIGTITLQWNPFVVGIVDRELMGEKGVRALQAFGPQLEPGTLRPYSVVKKYLADTNRYIDEQIKFRESQLADQYLQLPELGQPQTGTTEEAE